jgi:hypothetical protein
MWICKFADKKSANNEGCLYTSNNEGNLYTYSKYSNYFTNLFQGKYTEVSFDFKGDPTGGLINNCELFNSRLFKYNLIKNLHFIIHLFIDSFIDFT